MVPHAVALCLAMRHVYGVGNIRSKAEALYPVAYKTVVSTTSISTAFHSY
jgi:hypothetical protein